MPFYDILYKIETREVIFMEKTLFERFNIKCEEINSSEELQSEFTSSALSRDNRVYHLFNTNLKTLNTYYKYLYDIIYNPDEDNHQKYEVVRKLGVYTSDRNHPDFNVIKTRQDILLQTGELFEDRSSLMKNIMIFILSLRSEYNAVKGSEYLLNSLPKELLSNYNHYLKLLLSDEAPEITNPALGVYVLYSNRELLDLYLDLFDDSQDVFGYIIEALNARNYEFIEKRIRTCQKSALKMEAFLFAVYNMINELEIRENYEEVIKDLIDSLRIMIDDIGGNFGRLLFYSYGDFKKLEDFLLGLNDDERTEIIRCLSFETSEVNVRTIETTKTLVQNEVEGKDVKGTTSQRRGQNRFKQDLIKANMINGDVTCAISNCNIKSSRFLIASHIVPWKHSNSREKVDANNGLLLCPNHDLLFDSLLISFDINGKIMIDNDLSDEMIRAFGLNRDIVLDFTSEKEVYMCRHRQAFINKRWNE